METKFDIVFNGVIKEESDRAAVLEEFAKRFSISQEKAESMLPLTGRTILKRDVDLATAEKFQKVLNEIGIMVAVEAVPSDAENAAVPPVSTDPVGDKSAGESVPAYQHNQVSEEEANRYNPYAKVTPKRQSLSDGTTPEGVADEAEILSQRVFDGSVSVPASRGINWLTEGYGNYVRKNLGAWIGAMVIYFLISIVLSFIPLIGSIALLLIGPVVIAGFMLGAKEQEEGGNFTISHMFSAFNSPGQLMLVAVIYFVAMIAIVLITVSIFGLSLFAMADPNNAAAMDLMVILLAVLVMAALMIPVLMAYWFAPALVVLEGLSAIEALKQSFIGCLKNMLPMLVYGLLGTVLAVVAAIPLMLGYILLVPVIVASMYVAYRDIFSSSDPALASS